METRTRNRVIAFRVTPAERRKIEAKVRQSALQNGVDIKTVSSMLGHYDAGFTLRTYTHATRQKQDEAAATMGAFMEQML